MIRIVGVFVCVWHRHRSVVIRCSGQLQRVHGDAYRMHHVALLRRRARNRVVLKRDREAVGTGGRRVWRWNRFVCITNKTGTQRIDGAGRRRERTDWSHNVVAKVLHHEIVGSAVAALGAIARVAEHQRIKVGLRCHFRVARRRVVKGTAATIVRRCIARARRVAFRRRSMVRRRAPATTKRVTFLP